MIAADQLNPEPMWPRNVRIGADIAQQHHGRIDVADHEIGPAVVVEVADRQPTAAMVAVEILAAVLSAHVRERAVSLIAEQQRSLPESNTARKTTDMAVYGYKVFPSVEI